MKNVTYLGNPFEWLSDKLGAVDSKEAKCSMAGNANSKELVVCSDLHVTDFVPLELTAILTIINCSRISFVVDVKIEVRLVYRHNEGIVIFDRHQALKLRHWQILPSLERIAGNFA